MDPPINAVKITGAGIITVEFPKILIKKIPKYPYPSSLTNEFRK